VYFPYSQPLILGKPNRSPSTIQECYELATFKQLIDQIGKLLSQIEVETMRFPVAADHTNKGYKDIRYQVNKK
jgi:hypothetical protein